MAAMSSDQEKKDELQELIRRGKAKGESIVARSGERAQFGQYIADLADASDQVLKNVDPSGFNWESYASDWQYLSEQQDKILGGMAASVQSMASANTASYSMADFATANNVLPFVPSRRQNETRESVQRLSNVLTRRTQKDAVLALLNQYGFAGVVANQQSPTDLFETAWAAFEKPVTASSSASTSLIPMRECVNVTIAALLRRRPKQERAKSEADKILSICDQLFAASISRSAMESLARRWPILNDELSSAKQKSYTREECERLLRKSTFFLGELLESLDRSKIK